MSVENRLLELKEMVSGKAPKVSFEFFPPKTDEMEQKLWQTVKDLEGFSPDFVSVTYGAGGSTRERTHATVKRIKQETSLAPAAHLTCVNATKEEIDEVAKTYWDIGVKHIVALRGDPPDMDGEYVPYPGGYEYASDLVTGLKKLGDFEISVAAYPESHPTATSAEDDMRHLKTKIDAGAARAITQYFFDADDYFRFLDKTREVGIEVPIVPGILPISNFKQAVKFSKMCGATIPKWMTELFAESDNNPQIRDMLSVLVTAELCRKLISGGVDELHFYTLNRSDLTAAICKTLGLENPNLFSSPAN